MDCSHGEVGIGEMRLVDVFFLAAPEGCFGCVKRTPSSWLVDGGSKNPMQKYGYADCAMDMNFKMKRHK